MEKTKTRNFNIFLQLTKRHLLVFFKSKMTVLYTLFSKYFLTSHEIKIINTVIMIKKTFLASMLVMLSVVVFAQPKAKYVFYFIGRSFPAFLKCKSSVHGKDGKVQYER